MQYLFIALALAIPILDLASLIEVGGQIGVGPTLALVLLSGFAGVILIRSQGFAILNQARQTLEANRFPAREVLDGACVLIGGGLLMFPGFVSDVIGLLLLIPSFRSAVWTLIAGQIHRSGRFAVWTITPSDAPAGRTPNRAPVIEGEYEPVGDRGTPPADSPSPSAEPRELPSPWKRQNTPGVARPDDPC